MYSYIAGAFTSVSKLREARQGGAGTIWGEIPKSGDGGGALGIPKKGSLLSGDHGREDGFHTGAEIAGIERVARRERWR